MECLLPALRPLGQAARNRLSPAAAAPPVASRPRVATRRAGGRACFAGRQAAAAAAATPESPASSLAPSLAPTAPDFQAWTSSFANRHRRTDIKRIMILGAGPIVIGQACDNSLAAARPLPADMLRLVCPGLRV